MSLMKSWILLCVLIGLLAADGTQDISNPAAISCGGIGIMTLTCNVMHALLQIGPMFAVIALILAAIIYVYAHMFISADQRGRYNTLSTTLALGALILAAVVGASGVIIKSGTEFLTTPTAILGF